MGTKVLYLSVRTCNPLPWARNPKPGFYNNTFLASVFLHKQNLNWVINTGRTGLPEQSWRARRISHSTTASTTASAMARALEMSPTPAAWRTVLNIVAKKKLQIVDKLLMFLPELKVLQLKMTRSSRRVKMTMETQVIAPQRREHSFEQNWVGAGEYPAQCHIWNPWTPCFPKIQHTLSLWSIFSLSSSWSPAHHQMIAFKKYMVCLHVWSRASYNEENLGCHKHFTYVYNYTYMKRDRQSENSHYKSIKANMLVRVGVFILHKMKRSLPIKNSYFQPILLRIKTQWLVPDQANIML